MLQFIFGKPASGKTFTILNLIKELSAMGKSSLLLVPEQFTFESERAVLKTLGDKAAVNTSVYSFSRLCDEVSRKVGGIAGITLSDADKVIFMNRALMNVGPELKLWSKYSHSITFAKNMLDTLDELKTNAVIPSDLRKTAEPASNPTLRAKLLDTTLIFEAFEMLLGEKFIDPADKLTKLYRSLEDHRFFTGKTVFIDSFKGFTGQQFKIIDRIISQADNVYICLTDNPASNKDFNIFTNIRKAAERIKRTALAHGVEVKEPIYLNESYYCNNGLQQLEKLISEGGAEKTDDKSVNICSAATMYDEANFAARTIRRLVREDGYRYRDFVIIARDAEQYSQAVETACKQNGVSCFYDKRIPLSAFPMSIAANSAIKSVDLSTENILRFHKTGLGNLSVDEAAALENYTLIWKIDGCHWLKAWDMDPRGLVSDNHDTEKRTSELKYLNELREHAVNPLINFKQNFKGNAANMAAAIVNLFEECEVAEKLHSMYDRFKTENNHLSADFLRQGYDEFLKILDSLVRCFGEQSLKTTQFSEALNLAVSLSNIGVAPQMLDEVTFGSADRIRPSKPKIAFILGANQGIFPKSITNMGLFNLSERKILIESGLSISDYSLFSSLDEEYLVYSNLCCPSDAVYICYSRQSASREALEPATFVKRVTDTLSPQNFREPKINIDSSNAPETAETAFSEYCRRRQSIDDAATLSSALGKTACKGQIDFIESGLKKEDEAISPETAKLLYGKNINMSASKFDTFNRCRFSFFCRYGLNLKKLQIADFDILQRGTIVHFVLEKLIEEHKDDIASLTEQDLDILTDGYIEDYLDSVVGYRTVETARMKFLISRLSRSLKEVVHHIAAELAQSRFKPVACELKIGYNSELTPIKFPYDNGEIALNGSIDRLDEYNGYIRIIDYKTGNKIFKLPDIVFGLNLQMLIYLYAVTRGNGLKDSAAAGILYQPSSRDLNNKGMAMNGLLQCDDELVSAMDFGREGRFVPKLQFNKDGSLSKRSSSFIKAEEFTTIFNYIEKLMRNAGNVISSGDIAVDPLDGRESAACKYCDFANVCGIEDEKIRRVPELDNKEVFEIIGQGDENAV